MSDTVPKITTFFFAYASCDLHIQNDPWSGVSQFALRKKIANTRKGFFMSITYRATDSAALRRSNILT